MLGSSLVCAFLLMPLQQQEPSTIKVPRPTTGWMVDRGDALDYPDLLQRTHDYIWMLESPRPQEAEHFEDHFVEAGSTITLNWEGPSVISRLWMSATLGTVDFYVDGSEQPTLTWDFAKFAENGIPSYLPSPLGMVLGSSWDSHLPLPFNKSMEVRYTAPESLGVRLQVDCTNLGVGVSFPSVSQELLDTHLGEIKRTAEILTDGVKPETNNNKDPFMVGLSRYIEPTDADLMDIGEYRWTLLGKGMVRWMELTFIHQTPPAEVDEMLRSLEFSIEHNFDSLAQRGGDTVFRVPLGDFFGSGPGANPFYSYPVGLDATTGVFHFRMPIPFDHGISLVVKSSMKDAARFGIRVGLDSYPLDIEMPPMVLHSGWTRGVGKGEAKAAELHVDGPARLAGYVFSSTSPSMTPMTQEGTFAFADYAASPVKGGFGQVTKREGPGGFGDTSMMRVFGLAAPVGTEELWYSPRVIFPGETTVDYSALAWWYAPIDATSSMDTVYPPEQRAPAPTPEPDFFMAEDALEGESAQGMLMTDGTSLAVRNMSDSGQAWSRLSFLEWSTDKPDNVLVFPVAVNTSGKFQLFAQFAKGEAYGSFSVLVDGKQIGENIDCSGEGFMPSGELDLGELRLMKRPDHTLSLRSADGKHIGLDYFRLVPVTK
ncbi:MAG: DUF2961 domain-containing protein [Planctomycetota bacterium]|nr:DUF2961 domain-containing protein [Planctomycetota bacterium]